MLEGSVSTRTNQRGDRDAPGGDSERRFQTMVEHIPMIVTYMDLVEDDALRPTPVYMSPQICSATRATTG